MLKYKGKLYGKIGKRYVEMTETAEDVDRIRDQAKLKLFLWREVLCDYTDGVMFAIAETVDEARELIIKDYHANSIDDLPELRLEPEIITSPMGFALGGGS